jgi:hypothetical protein
MENQIIRFCSTPRTLKDICLTYRLDLSATYDLIMRMVDDGRLKETKRKGGAFLFSAAK